MQTRAHTWYDIAFDDALTREQSEAPVSNAMTPTDEPIDIQPASSAFPTDVREKCALPNCPRGRQYPYGFIWDRCCKECYSTNGQEHDVLCNQHHGVVANHPPPPPTMPPPVTVPPLPPGARRAEAAAVIPEPNPLRSAHHIQ